MRNLPKRYIIGNQFAAECPYGDFVRYGDYDQLLQENIELRSKCSQYANPKYGVIKSLVHSHWSNGRTNRQISQATGININTIRQTLWHMNAKSNKNAQPKRSKV
jgi:hypothetical protein